MSYEGDPAVAAGPSRLLVRYAMSWFNERLFRRTVEVRFAKDIKVESSKFIVRRTSFITGADR